MYDIIIKNGEIIDGGGKERYRADVAIAKGTIAKIGALGDSPAKIILDSKELIVAPGFIDALSHSDTYLTLFTMPGQESLVSQGVTTLIGGNCGYSLAPLVSSQTLYAEQHWVDNQARINVDWLRMSEFLENLSGKRFAVNFGTLTGYNTVARGVLKNSYREMNRQENDIAAFLTEQSLKDGSFGLSLGLAYLHHNGNNEQSFDGLFKSVSNNNKIVAVHLKDEGGNFLDSLNSILHQMKNSRTPVHISHLRVIHKDYWHNFQKAISLIDKAAKEGLKISFDIFPYASSSLALYLLLPQWAKKGGTDMILKRLKNSFEKKQIIKDLKKAELDYSKMTVASLAPDIFIGKTLDEISGNFGKSGEETLCELASVSNLQAIVFMHTLDESVLEMAITHPGSIIASSGAGYNDSYRALSPDLPHPRSFGTFPRLLGKYARDKKIISLEKAVGKITARPAEIFGIKKRGLIKEGYFADIAVFDPAAIKDKATFQNPYQYSQGIINVIVNGSLVYKGGRFVKNYPGAVLRAL